MAGSEIDAPAAGAVAMVASDDAADDLAVPSRGIWVGATGNLDVVMKNGDEVQLANIQDGTLIPVQIVRIKTSSTAGSVVALR